MGRGSTRATLGALAALALLAFASLALALTFPALSGRVVDQAGIVPAHTLIDIEAKAQMLEERSGIQLVVATVKSLEGSDIETYSNQLFRFWKLGEAKNNNGVLLLIAPNERKLRIEVGYGLEGVLTDALSKVIIANAIAPRFAAGDFGGGISRGVEDIITVLTTDAAEWAKRPSLRAEDQISGLDRAAPFLIFALFLFVVASMVANAARRSGGRWIRQGGRTIFIPPVGGWSSASSSWGSGGSWGSGSGSSWGGSSWGGGGGSSGGGGASGSW